ncbi:DUF397 domain-containing protein [Umezawaea sp. Da 62-37]|uniref:DUF397 domain-containing protein n=1 Tax=Umezawaea sp. Da 62-37 TaxID=3075927 RepID=UPI0037DD1A02
MEGAAVGEQDVVPDLTGVPDGSWRKSSFSSIDNCLEVAAYSCSALVRNSRNKHGEFLSFHPITWRNFLRSACDI